MKRFNYGELYLTKRVECLKETSKEFHTFLAKSFGQYLTGNWGNVTSKKHFENNDALRNEDATIVAEYLNYKFHIVIVTEWDRSRTNIMMKDEYGT